MRKVFVLPAQEDWIVDRFVKEWYEDNADISTSDIRSADVVWLLASWRWNEIDPRLLQDKKVITTIHHIVPEKFDLNSFLLRDRLTTCYHVYNKSTLEEVRKYTSKPIHLMNYWANQNIWKKTGQKEELRKKYRLNPEDFIIGSFQRDTEGKDLRTPKLEKGPDLFVEFVEKMKDAKEKKVNVLLSGWRRQYVMSNLEQRGIDYVYVERPNQETINELYQCLDLYAVSSRHEGGPQSLIECGLIGVPVVSTRVGIAEQVLQQSSINSNLIDAVPSIPNVEAWHIPNSYSPYRNLIQAV